VRRLALLCLLALAGCARKLPGPEECRAFALQSLGIRPDVPAVMLEQRPRLASQADELTHTCLTKPWDYELMSCLSAGGGQFCMARFEQRRLLGSRVE
jgi:hypothetical protein